jgi:glycosyltransferase involved in cell wall biosynthesis
MAEVSVVLPTYNRARLLPRAVQSVVAQTFTEWELIIVDDGSTDDTAEAVLGLGALYGERIRYVRQENAGASAARNRGVDESTGPLIAFLDSDDIFLPDKLLSQTRAMKAEKSRFSFTNYFCFDDRGRVFAERVNIAPDFSGAVYPKPLEFRCNCITTPSVMLDRETFHRAGGFDPEMAICEDIDLWTRVTMRERICVVPHALVGIHVRTQESVRYAHSIEARYVLYRKAFERDPELDPGFLLHLLDEAFSTYAGVARHRADHEMANALDESRALLAQKGADAAMIVARASATLRALESAKVERHRSKMLRRIDRPSADARKRAKRNGRRSGVHRD